MVVTTPIKINLLKIQIQVVNLYAISGTGVGEGEKGSLAKLGMESEAVGRAEMGVRNGKHGRVYHYYSTSVL